MRKLRKLEIPPWNKEGMIWVTYEVNNTDDWWLEPIALVELKTQQEKN
jgi:hypothetical protein